MSNFDKSRWADSDFSRSYRDEAEKFLPFRRQFIAMAMSFYQTFLTPGPGRKVLDLGCGDGLFIGELLKKDRRIKAVLVDGSEEMLAAARNRLSFHADIHFVRAVLQELPAHDPLPDNFDFIFSSLAIHHLSSQEKAALYQYIHDHLTPGGHFVHYDVVLPPADALENWYMSLWSEWLAQNADATNREKLLSIPRQYKENKDNTPDTLTLQMDTLKKTGFKDVDCYFKYGIFALFGGGK